MTSLGLETKHAFYLLSIYELIKELSWSGHRKTIKCQNYEKSTGGLAGRRPKIYYCGHLKIRQSKVIV